MTHSTTTGVSLQATNTDQLFGHTNNFVVGTSFDSSVTHFSASAELGTIGPNFVVTGSGIFLGPSGSPVSIGPVDLRATNQYTGLYALDTFDVTNAFSITGGGRFNVANISLQDQIRTAGTSLNGNDTYTRFNPIIGGTYKITPGLTAYAGYSEANRAPTPLELGCADPAHPCIIAAFLVSDPPLKQVVARTEEAGLRGSKDLSIGTLGWKFGGFRTDQHRRHPRHSKSGASGIRLFPERRFDATPGHRGRSQSEVERICSCMPAMRSSTRDFLTLCRSAPTVPSPTPTATSRSCRAIESRQFRATASRPASIIRSPTRSRSAAMRCSSAASILSATNPIRRRGCRGYAVFNLHASYQIDKTFQIYARVDNVFDNRYATYGTFFDTGAVPNFANGGAPFTDPRSLSPARPRAFYAGLKATF